MTIGHFQSSTNVSRGLLLGVAAMTNSGSVQHVEGETVYARFRFDTDGGCSIGGPGVAEYIPGNAGEYYPNEPYPDIGDYYDVRCESIYNGGPWTLQAASVGTWVRIDSSRTWGSWVFGMAAPQTDYTAGNFEIRSFGGSTILATAIHSCGATN